EDAANGRDLVGHGVGPLAPGVQHLGRALEREEQHARVDLAHWVEHDLDRGDHAYAPAPAAHGPEEVGLVALVGADELAVRGDDFDGGHAIGRQPVATGEPAHPAAEGVAHHAHVGG